MKISAQLEFEDYLESQVIGLSGCFAILIIGPLLLFFWFILIGSPYFGIGGRTEFFLILLLTGYIFFLLMYRYILLPQHARRIFKQQQKHDTPIEVEFLEQTIRTSSLYGNSDSPWTHFIKWQEGNKILMLYYSDVLCVIVPKRCFNNDEQIKYVRSRLRAHNIPLAPHLSIKDLTRTTLALIALLFLLTFLVVTVANQQGR